MYTLGRWVLLVQLMLLFLSWDVDLARLQHAQVDAPAVISLSTACWMLCRWLHDKNSCPVCRKPLTGDDPSEAPNLTRGSAAQAAGGGLNRQQQIWDNDMYASEVMFRMGRLQRYSVQPTAAYAAVCPCKPCDFEPEVYSANLAAAVASLALCTSGTQALSVASSAVMHRMSVTSYLRCDVPAVLLPCKLCCNLQAVPVLRHQRHDLRLGNAHVSRADCQLGCSAQHAAEQP